MGSDGDLLAYWVSAASVGEQYSHPYVTLGVCELTNLAGRGQHQLARESLNLLALSLISLG